MKYILIIGFLLFSTTLFAQQAPIVKIFNKDSTLMATGVLDGVIKQGLWKYYNPRTNQLLTEGTFKDGVRDGAWTSYNSRGLKKGYCRIPRWQIVWSCTGF